MKRALLAALAFTAACTSTGDGEQPVIVPSLVFPRTLPSSVAQLVVSVYEGNNGQVTCDTTTGLTNVTNQTPITTATLTKCPSGTGFCGTLGVPENANTRIFAATGCSAGAACTSASPNKVAIGCASAVLNQDAEPLSITMYRFIAPSNCGDGTIQPTETCDETSAVCTACQTVEVLMSTGSGSGGSITVPGGVGDKFGPSFLWPQGGTLLALFTDKSLATNTGTGNHDQLAMSERNVSFLPVATPSILTSNSIFVPNGTTFPATPIAGSQTAPSGALISGKYYVVYQDDQSANGLDIHMRSMDSTSLTADQTPTTPVVINGNGAGEAGAQSNPVVSAISGNLFVAWQDIAGPINGVAVSEPGNTLKAQTTIAPGTGNAGIRLAATSSGWIAAWQNGTDIATRAIGGSGTPAGGSTTVNSNSGASLDHPGIATLSDGRYAVVWHSPAGIFMQRYDNSGNAISGDQAAPINNLVADGNQSEPSIAAIDTASVKGYAIVWTDGTSGHIRARYADAANGFLFNNTTGQSDEFQASVTDGRTRGAPTVAVGGSGFVVFGWEDRTASAPGPGIVGRRFPLPPTQ